MSWFKCEPDLRPEPEINKYRFIEVEKPNGELYWVTEKWVVDKWDSLISTVSPNKKTAKKMYDRIVKSGTESTRTVLEESGEVI